MNALNVLMWLNLGLIAGWIVGEVMRTGGNGMVVAVLTGMLGAVVGGWAGSTLLGSDGAGSGLLTSIPAVVGAMVLTTVLWAVLPGRRAA